MKKEFLRRTVNCHTVGSNFDECAITRYRFWEVNTNILSYFCGIILIEKKLEKEIWL